MVHADQEIGLVRPELHSNFAEHLGSCTMSCRPGRPGRGSSSPARPRSDDPTCFAGQSRRERQNRLLPRVAWRESSGSTPAPRSVPPLATAPPQVRRIGSGGSSQRPDQRR
jgi:hypothetical protein